MKIDVEKGSGNVYADLGYPNAEEMKVKAALASAIGCAIDELGLTQAQAASLMGVQQPKVSAMLRGRFRGISEAKMMACLQRLGRNVHIHVVPAKLPERAEIVVVASW